MRRICLLFILSLTTITAFAQGTFTGDLMMNVNFFQSDPTIHASGNPLYDNYLSGDEGWLDLRYSIKGFTFFARVDGFDNSNLLNPTQAYNAVGIGAWSVSKDFKKLTITAGYIYDQIGSGILFRSYEDRGLLIDNALVGFELKYKLADNVMIKGFTGHQKEGLTDMAKQPTSTMQEYAPVIKALNIEGDFNVKKAHILPGIGVLNRTLDAGSMQSVVNNINLDTLPNRFVPKYNMYAVTLYNTLTVGAFSWYVEGAYKTQEAINPPSYDSTSKYLNKAGNVEYTTIGYAQKGIAIHFSGKRTDDFVMRTSPNEVLLNGMIDWQPVIAHLRPGRLMSRYTPASQDISEQAGTLDVLASPNDYLSYTFTGTDINTLDNIELYRELYGDFTLKGTKSWDVQGGIQYLEYNREIYQGKPNVPIVKAITPFFEATYHVNTTKSLRFETEYMNTKEDYGSWLYAILEYNIAPKWSLSASDMYNIAPNKNGDNPNAAYGPDFGSQKNHYYNFYVAYTAGPHRFGIAYVKQVDGYNCSGGVCRYEPAFSGVKATITSSF
jgi:Family of unknown function (DUF6029)